MTSTEQAELKSMRQKFEVYVKGDDPQGYHALNRLFHFAIYSGSHNQYLNDQAVSLYDRLAPYRAFQLRRRDALRLASEEHKKIVDAIISGHADEAYDLLVDHVSLTNDLFSDLLRALSIPEEIASSHSQILSVRVKKPSK